MDVDYARIAHYLRYYVWVDEAFHGALFERGFRIREFIEQGYGLPYISNSCRYFRPLTLEDEIEIQIDVTALDEKGFTLRFRLAKVGDSAAAAEGEIVRRCIRLDPPRSAALPQPLRQILEEMRGATSP
jgi:acyl-CoA thioesterase FadM